MSASLFSQTLPKCPESLSYALAYPSLCITFAIAAVVSLSFVLVVAFRYNNVRVFDHKIRTPSISNTLWITFFLFVFLDSLLNSVRFALSKLSDVQDTDRWFEGFSLTLHALSTLALSMALNHQRRFRSSSTTLPEGEEGGAAEIEPLIHRYARFKQSISAPDVVFMAICLVVIVLAWLAELLQSVELVLKWVFLGCFLAQRVPPLVLTVLIVFFPKKGATEPSGQVNSSNTSGSGSQEGFDMEDGPSRNAKIILLCASIFSVFGYVPLSLWALASPACVFWIGSVADLLHIVYITGLILYFLFLRSEYMRNMEECIWGAVQQFQRSFSFRKF